MSECSLEIYRNSDIDLILMGTPTGHKHLRLVVKTKGRCIVFHEATVAAIVRAYITIKTHPTKVAVKLIGNRLVERKKGYAEFQLLEDEVEEAILIKELDNTLGIK